MGAMISFFEGLKKFFPLCLSLPFRCFGTGNVISGFNGHYSRRRARRHGSGSIRMMSTCVKCTGTGWVRHSSAREVPSPFPNGNPQSPNLAIARKSMFSFDFDEEDGNEGSQQT